MQLFLNPLFVLSLFFFYFIFRNSKYKVTLDIQRPISYENLEKSPWRWKGKADGDDDKAEDESNTQNGSSEQNASKENEVSVDEDVMLGNGYKMATSTPFPGKLDRKIFHVRRLRNYNL